MICLVVSQSHLSTAAIVFCTCIWIPFLQLKRAVFRILGIVFFFTCDEQPVESCCTEPFLPVGRFVDLRSCRSRRVNNGEEVDESCSICLAEFDKEDVVSKVSKCGHIFHMECIERWINSDHFTCPLCRSFLFNLNAPHEKCSGGFLSSTSSYLGFSWH